MVVSPLGPRERAIVNPFEDVERVRSTGTTLPASREQAYALAEALAKLGHVALGAAPLVAYEWLQRPENVLAGHIGWADYRPPEQPKAVRIDHHKTGIKVWQPLEDSRGRFYPALEDYLKRVPRIGGPIVLMQPQRGPKSEETGERVPRPYSLEHARHLVQEARTTAKLPKHVTLAACRHGGMTELGNASLTEQQIMALSAHETPEAARIYVKRTDEQRMAAARRRREYVKAGDKLAAKAKMKSDPELEAMFLEVAKASEERAALAREYVSAARIASKSRNEESEKNDS
jgi:hypothetical protein